MESRYFLSKIKDVRFSDMLAFFPMALAAVTAPLFRNKYRNTWLIGEADSEARDNGYHFFRFMRTQHPEQPCVYFIAPSAHDAARVQALGPTVRQGSLRHWIMYFTCPVIISSQKGGKPNAAVCAFLELKGWFRPHFIFLQHGITKDRNSWLMADRCCFDRIITASHSEYEFMKTAFGYPEGTVKLTGFPRYDALHDFQTVANRILIMPTWRTWLSNRSSAGVTGDSDFARSGFVSGWLELLNSERLQQLAEQHGLEILFCPHRQLQKHLAEMKIASSAVKAVSAEDMDIQEALKSSALLITDYSSVFFDMLYMKKPVLFYQFDEEDFRKYHYEEGWFDYHDNPFAASYRNADEIITALQQAVDSGYAVSEEFLLAHHREFDPYDAGSSERVYGMIMDFLKERQD